MQSPIKKNELQQFIRDQWSDQQYPGDHRIITSYGFHKESLSPHSQKSDAERFHDILVGKTWQDVSNLVFEDEYHSSIFYLTPESYKYYLASYLTGILEEKNFKSNSGDWFVRSLNPSNYPSVIDFLSYCGGLDEGKRKAVKYVLDYLGDMMIRTADQEGHIVYESGEDEFSFWDR